jgi:hypothetical protein
MDISPSHYKTKSKSKDKSSSKSSSKSKDKSSSKSSSKSKDISRLSSSHTKRMIKQRIFPKKKYTLKIKKETKKTENINTKRTARHNKSLLDGYKIIPMKGHEETPLSERTRIKQKNAILSTINENLSTINENLSTINEKLNTINEDLDTEDLTKKLTVIISVNAHGEVIENPNKNKCMDIQNFPSNFITVFYKNKGVCGKVVSNDISNKTTSHEQIHKDYVNLINKNYKENKKNSITIDQKLLDGIDTLKQKENPLFPKEIDYVDLFNLEDVHNQDVFYNKINNKYELNEKTNKYIDKLSVGNIYYINKSLSFTDDNPNFQNFIKIFITIVYNDKNVSLEINKPNLSDFKTKLYNFLDIDIKKTESNKKKMNTEITFKQIFSILGELNDYYIDLFLLDYSCSGFPFKITKEEYVKLIKETKNKTNNLCSLGGKLKTIKR